MTGDLDTSPRTAGEVVDDHLRCRGAGDLEADLRRNYSRDVVVLSAEGVHLGHDGVRRTDEKLHRYLPDLDFDIVRRHVHEPYVLLEWSGRSGDRKAHDGADTFVIRDGLIIAQTIHFSIDEKS